MKGEKLIALREAKGLVQRQVSAALEVDTLTSARWKITKKA